MRAARTGALPRPASEGWTPELVASWMAAYWRADPRHRSPGLAVTVSWPALYLPRPDQEFARRAVTAWTWMLGTQPDGGWAGVCDGRPGWNRRTARRKAMEALQIIADAKAREAEREST